MFVAARACSIEDLTAPPLPDRSAFATDNDAEATGQLGPATAEIDEGGDDGASEWRLSCLDSMELRVFDRRVSLPRETYQRLHSYQRSGVAWMAKLFLAGHGGILADEMGLGKTVQVCSFLQAVRGLGASRALVLLPVTLLDQWKAEAHAWCPSWNVYLYHGTASQRMKALRSFADNQEGGIVLTSYSVFSNNSGKLSQIQVSASATAPCRASTTLKRKRATEVLEDLSNAFAVDDMDDSASQPIVSSGKEIPWDIVICDEAHKMRNISTLLGRNLRRIRARCKLLLTGTPVQNSLQDLWALMDFAQQGLLGNQRTFVKNFSDPINQGSVRGASTYAVGLKKHLSDELWHLVSPHLLRRTKMSVGLLADGNARELDADPTATSELKEDNLKTLPKKHETILWLRPTEIQVQAYKSVLEQNALVRRIASKSKLGVDVFQVIGLLKRLCNHPLLALRSEEPDHRELMGSAATANSREGRKCDEVESLLGHAVDAQEQASASCVNPEAEALLRSLPRDVEALKEQSAKLCCLAALLPGLSSKGHRTLVFAQGVKMLDLVESCVLSKLGCKYLRVDGKTSVASRAALVHQFNADRDKFQFLLLTTGVGGVGLNLVGADRVVIVDPAWNPQIDAQAVDRVFRIGQEREVRVYRLVMSGLIEDKMFRLQVFKMGLMRTALEARTQQHYFTEREIRGLFDWTDPDEGATRKLLVESHGEGREEVTKRQVAEDGLDEACWKGAEVVGMSNFSALYTSLMSSNSEVDACSAQIAEMKKRLADADDRIHQAAEVRTTANGSLVASKKEMDEASRQISHFAAARTKNGDGLAEKRSELAKIKRMQVAAEQCLKRAMQARETALARRASAEKRKSVADGARAEAVSAASAARDAMLVAEEALLEATEGVQLVLALVDCRGCAVGDGIVDVAVVGLQVTQRAFDQAREAFRAVSATQADLQLAWDQLCKADLALADAEAAKLDEVVAVRMSSAFESCKPQQARSQEAQEAAQARAEGAQQHASQCAQALYESGLAFVKTFRRAKGRHMTAASVAVAQEKAALSMERLCGAWKSVRGLQEAWLKATIACRTPLRDAVSAAAVAAKAAAEFAAVESEAESAAADEASRRAKRLTREAELSAAEAAKEEAERSEAFWRQRRDEIRARLGAAHLESLKSIAAEQEATERRSALQAWCSRQENLHLQMEASKFSAVEALRAETYNSKQVEEAYEARKRQRCGNEDARI